MLDERTRVELCVVKPTEDSMEGYVGAFVYSDEVFSNPNADHRAVEIGGRRGSLGFIARALATQIRGAGIERTVLFTPTETYMLDGEYRAPIRSDALRGLAELLIADGLDVVVSYS